MELAMTSFFEDVFSKLPRDCLYERFRRRQLCDYLSTLIHTCSQTEGHPEDICDNVILGIIRFHRRLKQKNCHICLMGNYHNILYVAARIAFLFSLQNTNTIQELLKDMFECEHTFERLFSGAIFGPRVCGTFSGWKSEFDNREECVEALEYFLYHAAVGRLEFTMFNQQLRMAEVPMPNCLRACPVTVALQAQRPDVFKLLVKYGARIHDLPSDLLSPIEILNDVCTYFRKETCYLTECRSVAAQVRPSGVSGWPLPSLKHLARVAVREALNDNFQLPMGIDLLHLELPAALIRYIRLEEE